MNDFRSLSHTKWDCKYHLIWILKYRKKVLLKNTFDMLENDEIKVLCKYGELSDITTQRTSKMRG